MISDEARKKMSEGGKKGGELSITQETRIRWDYPDMVISRNDAIQLGFTVYRTGIPCKRGHTGWRRTSNERCIGCSDLALRRVGLGPRKKPILDKNLNPEVRLMLCYPETILSREDAVSQGFSVYRDGAPCSGGHTGWRRVFSGICMECECISDTKRRIEAQGSMVLPGKKVGLPKKKKRGKRLSSDERMMRAFPDMIVDRAAAKTLGFKVFRTGIPCRKGHTGWRWIANNRCAECHDMPAEKKQKSLISQQNAAQTRKMNKEYKRFK